MKDLFIWTISAFAFSWILADSKISLPGRVWLSGWKSPVALFFLTLFECVACTGFHVGWVAWFAGWTPFSSWWIAGLFTCGANLLLAKVLGMLDPPE